MKGRGRPSRFPAEEMRTRCAVRRILVAMPLEGESSRRHLEGVFAYARSHAGLTFDVVRSSLALGAADLQRRLASGVDGVILLAWRTDERLELLLKERVPTVAISLHGELPAGADKGTFARVLCDNAACGRLAASHFLRGETAFRSFAFVPWETDEGWSRERQAAFAGALARRGKACEAYVPVSGNPYDGLAEFLRKLPRPAAVFAVNDVVAFAVESACQEARLRIPADVALVGMDNDSLFCGNAPVPLSTVEPDWERGGYLAAEMLAGLMRGRKTADVRTFGVRKIVVRESSNCFPFATSDAVMRALAYLDAHALEPIGVEDVVAAVGRSRRFLEKAFRSSSGESVLQALRGRRLKEAKRLLRNTRKKISEVAAATGFKSTSALERAFRESFGCSLRAYRKQVSLRFVR